MTTGSITPVPSDDVHSNDYNPNNVAPPEMELLRVSISIDPRRERRRLMIGSRPSPPEEAPADGPDSAPEVPAVVPPTLADADADA